MDPVLQTLATALGGFLAASTGFWLYLKRRLQEKDANTSLLLGLAHYKIVELGMEYIEKGFVTKDEYDDLIRYFYDPYVALGGNGSVERIMRLVQRLPLTLATSLTNKIADEVKIRATDKPGSAGGYIRREDDNSGPERG